MPSAHILLSILPVATEVATHQFVFYWGDAHTCRTLGCSEGRSSVTWVDFNFWGHQVWTVCVNKRCFAYHQLCGGGKMGQPLILEPAPPRSSASIRVPTGCLYLHTLVAPANGRLAPFCPAHRPTAEHVVCLVRTEAVNFTLPMHFSQS